MLIALCSLKASPGVTTLAIALGARWPNVEQPIVVEADPGGGDLLARWRLAEDPGVKSFAAAARRVDDPMLITQHTQALPGGLLVLAGPVGAEQARSALVVLAGGRSSVLRGAADHPRQVVICDLGRVDGESPTLPLLRAADATLVLARPRDDELAHVAQKLDTVARWTTHPGLVLVGDGYPTREVSRELRVEVLARLPHDAQGAAVLAGHRGRGTPARSSLGKAAAHLAELVRAQVLARREPPAASINGYPALVPETANGTGP